MTKLDGVAALRAERAELLRLCADLSTSEWRTESAAPGWRVQDVVAHLGASCRALFTPDALVLMRASDVEAANDVLVDRRRDWSPQRVLDEYTRWSALGIHLTRFATRTPAGRIPLPLGDLGTFRLDTLTGATVFDHHTHLRHDIAPSLGLATPPTDANRMAVVVNWMLAVLANQLRDAPSLPGPFELVLTGPGGGTWLIPSGTHSEPIATVSGPVLEFPSWGTKRSDWRDNNLKITGDTDSAERFLDVVNIV